MSKEIIFKPGQKVNYIGKGFIGFRTNDREAEFLKYDGMVDAYIKYDGYRVLVRKWELEKIPQKVTKP